MFPISRNWEIAGKHGRAIFRAGELRDLEKHFKFCFLIYLFCYHNSDRRTFKHRRALILLEMGNRKNSCYQLCCHYMVKIDEDKNGRTKLSPLGLLTDSNKAHRAITAQTLKAQGPCWKSLYWSQSVQASQDSMRLKGKKYFPFRPCYLFLLTWLAITRSWCLHLMFERLVCHWQECDCLNNRFNMDGTVSLEIERRLERQQRQPMRQIRGLLLRLTTRECMPCNVLMTAMFAPQQTARWDNIKIYACPLLKAQTIIPKVARLF